MEPSKQILFEQYSYHIAQSGLIGYYQKKLHNFTEEKAEVARGAPPPPIIFERQILPPHTICRWKGNLTANRIHFKY